MSLAGVTLLFALLSSSPEETERALLDSWRQAERSSPGSVESAVICHDLGNFYHDSGNASEAERFFKRALSILDESQPAQTEQFAKSANSLAVLYLYSDRFEIAEQFYKQHQPRWLAMLKPDSIQIARSWNNLGFLAYRRGDPVQAEVFYRKALAHQHFPARLAALINLGVIYSEAGNFAQAMECFNKVLTVEAHSSTKDLRLEIHANLNVAAIYCQQKRCDLALDFLDKALRDSLEFLGVDHPLSATAAERYAEALRALKHKDQAKRMDRFARELRENVRAAGTRHTVDVSELKSH